MRNDLLSARHSPLPAPRRSDTKKIGFCLLALLLLIFAGWWTYERFIRSDEDKIRDAILDAAQAARDRTPSGVTALLSDDFRGPLEADRELAQQGMIQLLIEFRHIEVELAPDPLPVVIDDKQGDTALAEFTATVRGKREDNDDWADINKRAGGVHFKAAFKRTERGWKMRRLTIGR